MKRVVTPMFVNKKLILSDSILYPDRYCINFKYTSKTSAQYTLETKLLLTIVTNYVLTEPRRQIIIITDQTRKVVFPIRIHFIVLPI